MNKKSNNAAAIHQVLFESDERASTTNNEILIMEQITKKMANTFLKDLRALFDIEVPTVSEKYYEEHVHTELELSTSLFNEGYLIFSDDESGLVELNQDLMKRNNVNPVITNAFDYVSKEGVLNNIEKRMIAPKLITKKDRELSYREEKEEKEREIKFESEYELPEYQSEKVKNKKRPNAGKGWFGMEAPTMTEELKQEIMALKLQHAASGASHNRDNRLPTDDDMHSMPKYFQLGKIVEGKHEFYSGRVNRRDRQQNFLDELLHEEQQTQYVSQRYEEIQGNLNKVQAGKKRRIMKKFAKNKKQRTN